jgi:hypothetical protein
MTVPSKATIAAMAAVVALLVPVIDQLAGHGIAAALFHARIVQASSAYLIADTSGLPEVAGRFIAGAGVAALLIVGAIALRAAPSAGRANMDWFLWLLGTSCLFGGAGTLLLLSLAPVGDVQAIVAGMPYRGRLLWVLTLLGLLLEAGIIVESGRALRDLARGASRRAVAPAIVIAYLLIGALDTIAAARNPASMLYVGTSALATTFIGALPLAFLWVAVPKRVDDPEAAVRRASPAWLTAGALAAVALVWVLGPGLPR